MLSEKLDRVMAAESAATDKIADAEKKADSIISEAKMRAEAINNDKMSAAKTEADAIIKKAEEECVIIGESYLKSACAEADRLRAVAAKNEMFGMSSVTSKIIP